MPTSPLCYQRGNNCPSHRVSREWGGTTWEATVKYSMHKVYKYPTQGPELCVHSGILFKIVTVK